MLWTTSGAIGVIERCESRLLGAPRHSIIFGRIRNVMLGAGVALMIAVASAGAPVIGDAADALNLRGSLPGGLLLVVNTVGSIIVFAAIYRWAPRATLRWRSAIVGADARPASRSRRSRRSSASTSGTSSGSPRCGCS